MRVPSAADPAIRGSTDSAIIGGPISTPARWHRGCGHQAFRPQRSIPLRDPTVLVTSVPRCPARSLSSMTDQQATQIIALLERIAAAVEPRARGRKPGVKLVHRGRALPSVQDKIREMLTERGPMHFSDIAKALDRAEGSIQNAGIRMPDVIKVNGTWRLKRAESRGCAVKRPVKRSRSRPSPHHLKRNPITKP